MNSAGDAIVKWNRSLKERFPSLLVGELKLSEPEFRELVFAVRAWGALRADGLQTPHPGLPYVTLAVMVFTARYDYEDSFWQAFTNNLNAGELDQSAWGDQFLRQIKRLGLAEPPRHPRKYVVPILFHSIIPERSRELFGKLARALCDSLPIRDMLDKEIAVELRELDLPVALGAFVNGLESQPVAIDLIRQLASDLESGSVAEPGTIRGDLLESALNATSDERARFRVQALPLRWHWDFATSRVGVWVAPSRKFESEPVCLRVGENSYPLDARFQNDGWVIVPKLVKVPRTLGAMLGSIDGFDGALSEVRIPAPPTTGPFVFRAGLNSGSFDAGRIGNPGVYAIVDDGTARILDALGEPRSPSEEFLVPPLPGATRAGRFELSEKDTIHVGDTPVFSVTRSLRPHVVLRSKSLWATESSGELIPVFAESPSLRATSPFSNSTLVVTDVERRTELLRVAFDEQIDLRLPPVASGTTLRAAVHVGGRFMGTVVSAVILPLHAGSASGGEFLAVRGAGTILLAERVTLSATDEVAVPLAAIVVSRGVPYQLERQRFDLHYMGPQPTLWGRTLDNMACRRFGIALDDADLRQQLRVCGRPGSIVALVGPDGSLLTQDRIGDDGLLLISLANAIERARVVDQYPVALQVGSELHDALVITSVPCIVSESFAFDAGLMTAGIAIDRPVDALFADIRVFNAPWLPPQSFPLEQPRNKWRFEAMLPERHYEITLRARSADGIESRVLQNGLPFLIECGVRYDGRSDLDHWVYDALQGQMRAAHTFGPSERLEALRRALAVLAESRLNTSEHIDALLRYLAGRMRVADISAVEALLDPMSGRLRDHCASLGIPVASFRHVVDPNLLETNGSSPSEIYRLIATLAESPDEATVADACNAFDRYDVPLIRVYADLLRRSRSRNSEILEGLEQLVGRQSVRQALAELPRYGGVTRWTRESGLHPTLFTRTAETVWGLAFIARGTLREPQTNRVPAGAAIASQFLCDHRVGDLMRIALTHIEQFMEAQEKDSAAC